MQSNVLPADKGNMESHEILRLFEQKILLVGQLFNAVAYQKRLKYQTR